MKLNKNQKEIIRNFIIAPLAVNMARARQRILEMNMTERDGKRVEEKWGSYDQEVKEYQEEALDTLIHIIERW